MTYRILKVTGITHAWIIGAVVVALAGLVAYLSITEYKPAPVQAADRIIRRE